LSEPTFSTYFDNDFHQALKLITTTKKPVLIISHEHPDADAHGSALGLLHLLKNCGVGHVSYANVSGINGKFLSLPGSENVTPTLPTTLSKENILIFVDCATKERIGTHYASQLEGFTVALNIDHHISNDKFGDITLLDVTASSTCEIVARMAKALKVEHHPALATCLLAGIVGDTGSFRYSQTSPETFETAAYLMKCGADHQLVSTKLSAIIPRDTFVFRNAMFARTMFLADGKIAGLIITKDLIESYGVTEEATEGLPEILRDIEKVEVSFVARQFDDLWRVSLRSHIPKHNVSDVAKTFGGGGHLCAAAFRWRGENSKKLEEALVPLLIAVTEHKA
jgi:bifunctional oligoribonuclease and PAP phosphatase NrnA